MNNLFNAYIESLTPAKQMIAREAVATYLRGESEISAASNQFPSKVISY